MAERRGKAGPKRSGALERSTPHSPTVAIDPDGPEAPAAADPNDAEPLPAVRIRGRTIYLPDDLFERILVQAHRHDRTISEYVAGIRERQVPDHRIARAEPVGESAESGAA
jgi:hypothetical protein